MTHNLLNGPCARRSLGLIAWALVGMVPLTGCPSSHPRGDDAGHVGEPCGEVLCDEGLFCCNASCSLCAPAGGGCIAVVCE